MANGTKMRQMGMQLQQVSASVVEIQSRVDMIEEKIGLVVDWNLEVVVKRFHGDMNE